MNRAMRIISPRATGDRGYDVRYIHVPQFFEGAVTQAGNFSSNLSRSFVARPVSRKVLNENKTKFPPACRN